MVDTETFRDRLLPDERVLWFGRPGQGIVFAPRDVVLVPFSLVWAGFAICWESVVLSSKTLGSFALFGLPFVLIGLFLVFGRFLLDAWLRSKTAYAVTERRILILRWGPWSRFQAIRLDRLPEANLSERAKGRGTIRFGEQASLWAGRGGAAGLWIPSLDPAPQFFVISDAKNVFATIQSQVQHP